MVNVHKSAAHTDSPDGGTGKMCLGGGRLLVAPVFSVVFKRYDPMP